MASEIVHMIADYADGEEHPTGDVKHIRTRCGRTIKYPLVDGASARYRVIGLNGNVFHCTTQLKAVSCIKCNIAITGATHGRAAG